MMKIFSFKKNDKGEYKLIPIDHTYCFPEKIETYFNWQFWSHAKKAFSQETLDYISSVNVLSDAETLVEIGLDEKSIFNVIGATLLLQKMTKQGATLFQIASAVSPGKGNILVNILKEAESRKALLSMSHLDRAVCIISSCIDEFLNGKS